MKSVFSWMVYILFFSFSFNSYAADYNNWVPHLPDSINGLRATSKGEGMNMNADGMDMSTLTKSYGSGRDTVDITILHESSGAQSDAYVAMGKLNVSTRDYIQKTIKVGGFDAVYQDDKLGNRVNIMVFLKGKTIVSMDTAGGKPEEYYTSLVNRIELDKISSTLK